ncbi:uncharacterized protein LAJ45_03223 [Morchella importuna]|uniref:uncharacterized protein n=1 Tax=Morchella importuna TaxID=1174673 RepID=UPI001E8CE04F|nr:uncharacterized protein LAJ45_03223 [Morchella importuna]KAH8152383.1 hypothetical protein LAJ45_03223 [Morchella importuna]
MVRLILGLLALAAIVCDFTVSAILPNPNRRIRRQASNCSTPVDPAIKAPKPNPWLPFSRNETATLLEWLHAPAQGLNLTVYANFTPWDNRVGVTELLIPNKTDVLNYLEGGPAPVRYARVELYFGATENPYTEDYIVGPIPVSEATTINPLNFIYNKGNGKSPVYAADYQLLIQWAESIGTQISDIMLDILGTDLNTSRIIASDPKQEDGRTILWAQYGLYPTSEYDSGSILPQGLFLKTDITGRKPEEWKLLNIFYDNILYDGVDEFRKAWETPGFNKLTKQVDGNWTHTGRSSTGESIPLDERAPPISIQPEGQRFSVDKDENYVKWMDFEFYTGFSRDLGVTLYNIKYKGKRIIYELGLQEAIAHYAGNDPMQSRTAYLDSYYGFGPYVFELLPGYDCPTYSTFLKTSYSEAGYSFTNKDSICLFEQDAGYPLQRHTSRDFITVTKNTVFTLRFVSTVGNYDYNFDYNFYLDGSIEVKVRASGYIQAAFYANNEDYGYKIHDAISGSMHDHVLNFKADIDVLGVKNTFEKVAIVSDTVDYVWSPIPRNTMRLERSFVENEDDGKINWPTNSAAMYVVVNTDEPNIYGEYPGYRILPGSGSPIHLTIQNSSNLLNSAEFGTHHLYVTKQKDTEPRSAAAANSMDLGDPLVNFGNFFDSESLAQEDIVVWFNLGMHHVPHTGDLPNTVFTTGQSSVFLSPHNYLLGDPSRFTSQQVEVRFTPGVDNSAVVKDAPSTPKCLVVDMSPMFPDFSTYQGGEQTRKFPYTDEVDPNASDP